MMQVLIIPDLRLYSFSAASSSASLRKRAAVSVLAAQKAM
jgi:hypothetical protein